MPDIELKPLPFEEAIAFFREKGYEISADGWRDVWAAEHVQAFTVARVTAMDVLEDIRGEVDKAIEKGTALNRFKAELTEILERKGWAGELPPWRLSTIYRTNLQGAYGAGRYMQQLEVARRRPWWLYDAVEDLHTRPSHAMHDGEVRRFDHPFWDAWYPPNGFNCRCAVRTLSDRQMQQRGLEEETRGSDFKPDEGFEYNPGMEKWKPDLMRYSPEARAILEEELARGSEPLNP